MKWHDNLFIELTAGIMPRADRQFPPFLKGILPRQQLQWLYSFIKSFMLQIPTILFRKEPRMTQRLRFWLLPAIHSPWVSLIFPGLDCHSRHHTHKDFFRTARHIFDALCDTTHARSFESLQLYKYWSYSSFNSRGMLWIVLVRSILSFFLSFFLCSWLSLPKDTLFGRSTHHGFSGKTLDCKPEKTDFVILLHILVMRLGEVCDSSRLMHTCIDTS